MEQRCNHFASKMMHLCPSLSHLFHPPRGRLSFERRNLLANSSFEGKSAQLLCSKGICLQILSNKEVACKIASNFAYSHYFNKKNNKETKFACKFRRLVVVFGEIMGINNNNRLICLQISRKWGLRGRSPLI